MKDVVIPAKMIDAETAEQFFTQCEGLEMGYIQANERSRKTAWRVAGIATGCCFMMAFAIASLAPMHTVEWRLIRVSDTGPVDVVTTLDQAGTVVTDANIRFFLSEYVMKRESFIPPEAAHNFRVVGLMSDPNEQRRVTELLRGSNPEAPQNVFGRTGGYVRVTVESTNILAKGLGIVDFAKEERTDPTTVGKVTRWRATVSYTVSINAKMKDPDRNLNPLGFQVHSYHADAVVR